MIQVKTQKEVNTREVEAAATGKGYSEEEGGKDLGDNAILFSILSTLENMSRKFDHIDSRFNAYELERNRPLVDHKTIDDLVKASVEERLKVLGKKSVNSPALAKTRKLAKTPGKVLAPKRNLANKLDKDTWVKRILAEEFGSGAATPVKLMSLISYMFLLQRLQRLLRMIRMLRVKPMDAATGASLL
ncbi:hypothetical protein Bca52824_001502 [Brassica carinata]|uniref:Uncharacterized protein n=1 Tax=Brassica carinata TaxID=52824 RepID=A0A8X8BD48_BRACI|nr:hypothetical protein Bca52824_001502 [Brassica carinata]